MPPPLICISFQIFHFIIFIFKVTVPEADSQLAQARRWWSSLGRGPCSYTSRPAWRWVWGFRADLFDTLYILGFVRVGFGGSVWVWGLQWRQLFQNLRRNLGHCRAGVEIKGLYLLMKLLFQTGSFMKLIIKCLLTRFFSNHYFILLGQDLCYFNFDFLKL